MIVVLSLTANVPTGLQIMKTAMHVSASEFCESDCVQSAEPAFACSAFAVVCQNDSLEPEAEELLAPYSVHGSNKCPLAAGSKFRVREPGLRTIL